MADPGKVVVAVVAIVAIATTIRTIVMAAVYRLKDGRSEPRPSVADARLARLEQAVDAIALEIERISEGQRFTTRLLSEQARQVEKPVRQLSSHTPV